MARTLNAEEYAVRRNEILDVTLRLIYTKGYEHMTVHDVLDVLKISKGAFYHYFNSKQDLMECVIQRMVEEGLGQLAPTLEDQSLPALTRLQHYFNGAVKWKTARKAELLAILRIWYADENALVRQKTFNATISAFAPAITKVVRQGVAEGVLHPAYPNQVGTLLVGLMQAFGESFSRLFLEPDPNSLTYMMEIVAAYTDAIEHLIGAPSGSLRLIDETTMKVWLEPDGKNGTRI